MDEDEDEPDDDYNKSAVGGSAGFDEIEQMAGSIQLNLDDELLSGGAIGLKNITGQALEDYTRSNNLSIASFVNDLLRQNSPSPDVLAGSGLQ